MPEGQRISTDSAGGDRAQAEMHRPGAGRSVTGGEGDVVILRLAARDELDPCADRVAVALGALELNSSQ